MKILIIESNAEISKKYMDALSQAGFHIYQAKSAVQGLKMLNENTFSLVLLNIILPDMHGLNFIKRLYMNNPDFNIPLIILTEFSDDDLIREAFNLNVKGYLVHSHYTPEQVAGFIKTALYSSQDPSFQIDLKELNLE